MKIKFLGNKSKIKQYENIEGYENFFYKMPEKQREVGISAMLRIKNEGSKITECLNSIIDIFDELVVVNNASTDDTLQKVNSYLEGLSKKERSKVKLIYYPFNISRCGREHYDTDENSVHSLVYYYNWCISNCRYSYVAKWDGEMYFIKDKKKYFSTNIKKILSYDYQFGVFGGLTVYKNREGDYFLSKEELHYEPSIFFNSYNVRYQKAENWEILEPDLKHTVYLEKPIYYEMKFIGEEEYAHWSKPVGEMPLRKQREIKNYNLIKNNNLNNNFIKINEQFKQN